MNNPKEIILSIQSNEDNSFDNNEIKKLDEQLDYWISYLKGKLKKKLYKIALKEIDTRRLMEIYGICSRSWELTIISIKAKLKIIKNKITKYNFSIIENQKTKIQINHCKKYFELIRDEFNILFDNNDIINKELIKNLDLIDELLLCYSQYIYISALFNRKIGNFIESFNYLILIINFYNETSLLIKSPNTLYYIEKVFIILCQILISNKDYLTALGYLNQVIEICFKIILFQTSDINNGVLIGDYNKLKYIRSNEIKSSIKDLKLKKIFLNIVILFFYKAICQENIGNIKKTLKCYKQCNWFSSKFLKDNDFKKFSSFIFNVKEKYVELNYIYDIFVKTINDYDKKIYLLKNRKIISKINTNNIKIDYSKYYSSNSKYKELMKKINSMKIREIDTVSKFSQKKNIKCLNLHKREGKDKNIYLDNMRILEAYLRKDFQNIIIDMDKIKLFDLDYNTRERIQKNIYRINFEKIMNDKKKEKLEKAKRKSIKFWLCKTIKINKKKSISPSPLLENKKKFYSMEIKSFTPKNKTMKIKSHSNIKDSINIQDNYNNSNDNKEICNKSTINEYTYNTKSTKKKNF